MQCHKKLRNNHKMEANIVLIGFKLCFFFKVKMTMVRN